MTLEFHPYANLFPLLEGDEFNALSYDIGERGLLEKIVLLDGKILDGRNRYRACISAGLFSDDVHPNSGIWFVEFNRVNFHATVIDAGPLSYVLSKNLARRHLNESQRAMVAARLATLRQGEQQNVKPANLPVSVSQPDAAKTLNVSERSIRSARVVQEKGTPELAHAVDQGKLPVSNAAQAAKLPPEQQQKVIEAAEAGKANIVRTVIKQESREAKERSLGARQQELPDKKYGVIVADPEWEFKVWSKETGRDRSPDNHYPTSEARLIAARSVQKITAKDCIIGLWITDLERGINTLHAWGFQLRSYLVWVKDIVESDVARELRNRSGFGDEKVYVCIGNAGTGFWSRDRDEIMLIGVRGDIPCPAPGTQSESVIFAARPRNGEGKIIHSAKPDEFVEWFERYFPNLPKIELNARRRRGGWDAWGNELPEEIDGDADIGDEERSAGDEGNIGFGDNQDQRGDDGTSGERLERRSDHNSDSGEERRDADAPADQAGARQSAPAQGVILPVEPEIPEFLRRKPETAQP